MVRLAAGVAVLALATGCDGAVHQNNVAGPNLVGGSKLVDDRQAGSGTRPGDGTGAMTGTGGLDSSDRSSAVPNRDSAGGWTNAEVPTGGNAGALGGAQGTSRSDSGPTTESGGSMGAGGRPMPPTGASPDASVSVGSHTCASLPATSDYGAVGPFGDAKMFTNLGPNGNYTLFRPDATLGQDGFLHPIATWGNGITTTPDMYQKTLPLIASHGFVIIACNDTKVEEPCLTAGLDWLVEQNAAAGPMKGKLDTTREVAIGYSWGGGASIDASVRPNIKATVSLHGMPPREDPWAKAHAPLLLFTSTGDNFVTASEYVTPNYQSSTVPTFYATLNNSAAGHLYVVDEGAAICIGSVLGTTFGTCGNAALEHAPTIAWLRLWTCGDENAKRYFYGDNCALCQSPWAPPQRKAWQ